MLMTLSLIRKRYLDFFAARGHAVIPSAPLIPENDPTTLFTSSGMQPLIPYLLGKEHAAGARLVNAQMCFRAEDIDDIGDNRHTTFFEMLGNWSLGDYFKREQLPWIFTFLTDEDEGLGLDPHKLYVTVFDGDSETGMSLDTEAVEIWQELFAQKGIEASLVRIGTEKEGGEKGMQGGRIFSYGAKKNWWSRAGVPQAMPAGEPGGPDSEIFYDFGTPHDNAFGKECHVNCDCGRFFEIGNSVFMQFIKSGDGSFAELPKRNVDFGGGLIRLAAALRNNPDVFLTDIFDEARAVLEARSGRAYDASRRSFRIILDHIHAATFFMASGITPGNTEQPYVLRRLIRRAIREADRLEMKDSILPALAETYAHVYADTYPFIRENMSAIKNELGREEERFRATLEKGLREFARMKDIDAFTLFTTYGFPIELTAELARERGTPLDLAAVQEKLRAHQERSRAGAAQKFAGGLADHSTETVRYHTAHHLLLKALQMTLGDAVHQRGSNITAERLRMDFSYDKKVTPEQLREAERIVNEKIDAALPVIRTVMEKKEAEQLGAEHEFGASYPERVTVYSVGPKDANEANPRLSDAFSIEFCGGPHVENTREIGEGGRRFKILKEEASSAGVRRIKAVLA